MSKTSKRFLSLAMALVLMGTLCLAIIPAVRANDEYTYTYLLQPVTNFSGGQYDGRKDGQVKLDLFVISQASDGTVSIDAPPLNSGSVGLRFPTWIENLAFAQSDEIQLRESMTTKPVARYDYGTTPSGLPEISVYHDAAPRYHFFTWSGVQTNGELVNWSGKGDANGYYGLKLGTYTFNLPFANGTDASDGYKLPKRTDFGLQDWLLTAECQPVELGESDAPDGTLYANDKYNKTIWSSKTELYQGYYTTSASAELVQVDIGFTFKAPSAWASISHVFSYDPKKAVSGEVTTLDGTKVASLNGDTQSVWNSTRKDLDDWCSAVFTANTGTGAYLTGIRLDTGGLSFEAGQNIIAETDYYLVLHKPGSLTQKFRLTAAADGTLEGASGTPETGYFRLLAGDINPVGPVGSVVYGDGVIDLQDRAALLSVLGKSSEDDALAYVADLDGDGCVTMADLSILMSPENYAHSAD